MAKRGGVGKLNTYYRRHGQSISFERPQVIADVNVRAIENDIEDGMSSTGIIAELVCKPDAFSGRVIKVCRTMTVFAP